jgi:hypothetical protein
MEKEEEGRYILFLGGFGGMSEIADADVTHRGGATVMM